MFMKIKILNDYITFNSVNKPNLLIQNLLTHISNSGHMDCFQDFALQMMLHWQVLHTKLW